MSGKSKYIKISFIILLLLVLADFFHVFCLPKVVNINSICKNYKKEFFKKTDLYFSVENPVLTTYPDFSVSIKADKINVFHTYENTIFSTKNFYLKIQPLKLLFRKLKVKEFQTSDIFLDLSPINEKTLNQYNLKNKTLPFEIEAVHSKIKADKYKIYYSDLKNNQDLILSGQNFDIEPLRKGLSSLNTKGELKIGNEIAYYDLNILSKFLFKRKLNIKDFSATGKIIGINLKALEPYLAILGEYENANGKADIIFNSQLNQKNYNLSEINIKIKDLAINKGNFEHQILAPGENILQLKFQTGRNDLHIEELIVSGMDFSLLGKGSIQHYNSDKPDFNLSFILPDSKIEKIVDVMPYGICPEINIIKKHGISGNVEGTVNISGKLPELKLLGNIDAKNIQALRKKTLPHKGDIKINFIGTEADMNIFVETPDKESFSLKGNAQIYDTKPSIFNIETTDNFSAVLTCDILTPISRIFGFDIGPVPFLDVEKGTGKALLNIKGTKKIADLNGYINIKDAQGKIKDIKALIKTDLNIDFSGKNINYKSTNSKINDYTVFFNGTSTTTGDLNLNLSSNEISSQELLNILKNSPILNQISSPLKFIEKVYGKMNFSTNISGHIEPSHGRILTNEELVEIFNHNIKTTGEIETKNNTLYLTGFKTPVKKISGKIEFTEKNLNVHNLQALVGNSEVIFSASGDISENNTSLDIKINGESILLKDSLNFISESDIAKDIKFPQNLIKNINGRHTLTLKAKTNKDFVDLKAITADIKMLPIQNIPSQINIPNGKISINKDNIEIQNLDLNTENSKLALSGEIKHIYTQKPYYNINISGNSISVKTMTDLLDIYFSKMNNLIKSCKNYRGFSDINLQISNQGINGYINFRNLEFRNTETNIPFSFKFLPIKFNHNNIILDNINGTIGKTAQCPIFLKSTVKNYTKIPIINGSAALKISPNFVEHYINRKLLHPVKVIGEISLNADINGSIDSLSITPVIKINKDSDITYLSTTLGDTNFLREIKGRIFLKKNILTIKDLEYIQYKISNHNKTHPVSIFSAGGIFYKHGRKFQPYDFYLKTNYKISAKMLNFLFKKSLIKNGDLQCNFKYNNKNKNLIGYAEVQNLSIPLYNIELKNGAAKANAENIILIAQGSLDNTDYEIISNIKNSYIRPIQIKSLNIKTEYIDLERLINTINKWSIDAYMNTALQTKVDLNISDITIQNGTIEAHHIDYKTAPMEDFSAKFSLDKNGHLKIDTKNFKMVGGEISGNILYKFKSGDIKTKLRLSGIDSNESAKSFFGLKNQISGKLDGNVEIETTGPDDITRLKNLNGKINFTVADGNMTKLGSAEYLLRASNILYSGLTTLSVNNLIELFKPFKQGSFSNIKGNFNIEKGIIKDIEIYSKGENMSLFIDGSYDIANSDANVNVYGKLGKKIDNLIAPIGNISANTLLNIIPKSKESDKYEDIINKIPDVEYKNQDVKVFKATVEGNINTSSKAASFKWLK